MDKTSGDRYEIDASFLADALLSLRHEQHNPDYFANSVADGRYLVRKLYNTVGPSDRAAIASYFVYLSYQIQDAMDSINKAIRKGEDRASGK